jgi:hypothetical protein
MYVATSAADLRHWLTRPAKGHVANDVESEQIVHDASTSRHDSGCFTSFVHIRGSIPAFWSQDAGVTSPKPPIAIDRADPFALVAAYHFDDLFHRYGTPIVVFNLVKQKEKKPREMLLFDVFTRAILSLNYHLPKRHHIHYFAWDMAAANKEKSGRGDENNIVFTSLMMHAEKALAETGFFHSGPQLRINAESTVERQVGGLSYGEHHAGRRQHGALRVNCVDCLDRTNTAMLMVGWRVIAFQLHALGAIPHPRLSMDNPLFQVVRTMYEDHGDVIALQYGGSQLVNRLETYRKSSQLSSHSRDILHTIQRFYNNSFTDDDKQKAINLFLGVFVPSLSKKMLTELESDYWLHYTHPQYGYVMPRVRFSRWWTGELDALPMNCATPGEDSPLNVNLRTVTLTTRPGDAAALSTRQDTAVDAYVDDTAFDAMTWSFSEFYREHTFCSLVDLMSFSIPRYPEAIRLSLSSNKAATPRAQSPQSAVRSFKQQMQRGSTASLPAALVSGAAAGSSLRGTAMRALGVTGSAVLPKWLQPVERSARLPRMAEEYGFEPRDPPESVKRLYNNAVTANLATVTDALSSMGLNAEGVETVVMVLPGGGRVLRSNPTVFSAVDDAAYRIACEVVVSGPKPTHVDDVSTYERYVSSEVLFTTVTQRSVNDVVPLFVKDMGLDTGFWR